VVGCFEAVLYPLVNGVPVDREQFADFIDRVAAESLYTAVLEITLCQMRPVFCDFTIYMEPRTRGCKTGKYGEVRGSAGKSTWNVIC
jgi:hypothetical protein